MRNAEVAEPYVFPHHELEARGVLKHTADRRRESEALKGVRYWDGSRFTTDWVPLR